MTNQQCVALIAAYLLNSESWTEYPITQGVADAVRIFDAANNAMKDHNPDWAGTIESKEL